MTGTEQVAASSPEQCPECGGPVTTADREAVCEECGLVVGEHTIDHGPDWRSFEDGPDTRRAAPTTSLRSDSGLGSEQPDNLTETGIPEQYASGWAANRHEMYLRGEVYRIGAALDWQTTHKERAADLITEIYDGGGLQGNDLDTIAAAVCWLVSRMFGLGLSPASIAGPARDVDSETLLERGMWVKRELELPMPLADYETRVRRVGESLGLGEDIIEEAVERVRDLDGTDKSGREPSSLAAAALYLSADREYSQTRIAEAADSSETSIRYNLPVVGSGGELSD
jgi:transcription initiation factor TFIIB